MRVAPQEEWDFYPCRVDGEPASISLNLWFLKHPAPEGCDTLVHVRVDMHDPGEHGMGTRGEASSFRPLEDALCEAARASRFHLVGRIRTGGVWQLAWYGPSNGFEVLQHSISAALAARPGRSATTDVMRDPEWRFLHDFLAPDEGSIQWMADRRVVDSLSSHGDRLEVPRPVDHWVRFDDDETASAFGTVAEQLGFRRIESGEHEPAEGFRLHLERTDPVVLSSIHDVAQGLRHLSERFGGEYDGWGCGLVQDGAEG